MPLAPYATLRASVNGASNQTGGITCAGGESIVLSADPAGALTSFKIEIYDYPPEFSLPSGWSSIVDATGATVFYCTPGNGIAPAFALGSAAHWWKYMFRLTGNNGDNGGNKNIPASQLVDEKTAITVPAASGIQQIGRNETTQFNPNWNVTLQKNMRVVDVVASSAAASSSKAPAALLGASSLTLSGEQTIDGTLTSGTRVLLVAQGTSSQNGLWITAAGAWSRPADFNVDAQVIVGQTVFITGGSLNGKTNWQLTSGNTIAGAKTYAQLVGSTTTGTGILPVDAVDTTNNAKSGTTAVDGVTLTANVSRVILVNQTASSENGPWLVQVGAWTRPSDFALDAQVLQGSVVYVKSGSLGSGTSWQLTSGTTIAGAKSFTRVLASTRAAVRCVQTLALPAYTYNAGAKTLTANANGALSATIFDGVLPLVADKNHDVLVIAEGTKNGLYTKMQDGDASHPWIFVRRFDLNTTAGFDGGVSCDVLDGATTGGNYKGTRWQLSTQGAIVLDTTSTSWTQMAPKGWQEIDLTLPPYSILLSSDWGIQIQKFFDDTKTANVKRIGKMPAIPGAFWDTPAAMPSNCGLLGCGIDATRVITNKRAGGPFLISDKSMAPTAYGGTIDTAAGATPISLYDTSGGTNYPWLNLTDEPDLHFDNGSVFNSDPVGWSAFELVFNFNVVAINSGGSDVHVISCRGRRNSTDGEESLFQVFSLNGGTLQAKLRLTDVTTGVYSAFVRTGTGTSVMTGDVTVTPTDDNPIWIRIVNGGTIGVAGITVQHSTDLGITWEPGPDQSDPAQVIAIGTATSLTISRPRFTAKVNFAAGTVVRGDVYKGTCSGVQTTYTLNAGIVNGNNYEATLSYDGSNIKWYVSQLGAARDTGPLVVGGSGSQNQVAHGVALQKPWENTMLGHGINYSLADSQSDFFPAKFNFGAIRFCDGNITTPPSTTRTTIPSNVTNQRLFFRPGTDSQILKSDGTVMCWKAQRTTSDNSLNFFTIVNPRRISPVGGFAVGQIVRDFTLDSGTGIRNGTGMAMISPTYSQFGPLRFIGGSVGFKQNGPSFFTQLRDFSFSNVRRISFRSVGGECSMLGYWVIDGGICMMQFAGAASSHLGILFLNGLDETRGYVWIDQGETPNFQNLILDDENNAVGTQIPREHVRAVVLHGTLSIGGNIGAGLKTFPIVFGTSAGRLALDKQLRLTTSSAAAVRLLDAAAQIVECGPGIDVGTAPLSNIDRVRPYLGTLPSSALTDADQTITLTDGLRSYMIPATASATRTKTISPTAAKSGATAFFTIYKQTNDVAFVNGGPSGGTLVTVASGAAATVCVRKNVSGDVELA